MWRCSLVLVLVLACSKKDKVEEKKDAAVVAPEPKLSDKSAADIMADKMAKAKDEAAAQTPPPMPMPPPTPEPPPAPVTPPAPDPLPAEEPVAADTGSGSGSEAAPVFKVGERVMAKWDNAKWYPGRIVGIKDGKYDVDYDDGDKSRGLVPHRVRKMPADQKPR